LREVIEAALAERDEDADFVFPEAASMIKHNPDGVTWRFKKLVADVMPDPAAETDAEEAAQEAAQGGERVPLADILPDVESAVAAKLEGAKRDRVLDTLRRYAAGASVRAIEKETKVARSTVSADLHLAEDVSGRRFMPDAVKGGGGAKERIARITRTEATGRARRASVLDWHALRTSWVTLALSAGVPVEVCRLVTGHRTVDVVMRHYFKPGAEALRTILGDKLPNVLTGNGHKPAALPPPKEEAPDRLAGIVAGLSENDRERLAAMLAAKG
jgi:hypothetical protein